MTAFEELRAVPLFEGLTDEELRRVAEESSEKLVLAGESNGREGESVEHLYVILKDELRITKQVDGGEVVINTYTLARSSPRCRCSLGRCFWRRGVRSRIAGCS